MTFSYEAHPVPLNASGLMAKLLASRRGVCDVGTAAVYSGEGAAAARRSRVRRSDGGVVFASPLGGHLDGSALRRRFVEATRRAGLRALPFHSLRHFFGSMAVNKASLVQVQAWMGHAHIQTTARYLHHRAQHSDAALLADAFRPNSPATPASDGSRTREALSAD